MVITEEDLIWEETDCDGCGASAEQTDLVMVGPDRMENLPGVFQVVRCRQCGILRQNPRLAWESLKDYYTENYDSHPKLVRHEKGFLRRLDKRYGPWKRLRALERYQSGGKLLEVGCGTGLFLEEALRSGHWDVAGVEPSERAAAYVRNNLNVPIHQELFTGVQFPAKTYDVVAMWNVLEHLDRPFTNLRHVHHILKDQGWLVIAIPNLEGWEARTFGKDWMGWELPRHLYYFPRPALRAILADLGFRWVEERCISTSYSVFRHTLNFWSQGWEKKYPQWKKFVINLYNSPLGRIATAIPFGILDRLKQSTIITIFAQKS